MGKKHKKVKITHHNYIERDTSWLSFNRRVLYQATRKEIPIEERLKFVGICTSNLDEFIMVRFASHMGFKDYDKLRSKIIKFKRQQEEVLDGILKELSETKNVKIVKYKNLSKKQKIQADRIFEREIRSILVPMSYTPGSKFPHIKSGELCALIGLENSNGSMVSIISLEHVNRLYELESNKGKVYILCEEIVFNNLNKIFGDMKFYYKGLFKLNRSASMELNPDEDRFIVDKMKEIIVQREYSVPVLMDVSSTVPAEILSVLSQIMNINSNHIYKTSKMVDLSFLMSHPFKLGETYNPFTPYDTTSFEKKGVFKSIDLGDVLLHHPYESFNPIIRFIEEAAEDEKVVAIRQTLYRVSSYESPIVNALCKAAENGKKVSIMLEIKARFDESRNISLIDKLTDSGCEVIYGIDKLKTHCKFCIVVRKTKKGLKSYAHIGTGNYNDKTAKIYTDLSLFTSDQTICKDLISIFNILSGFAEPAKYIEKIRFAPINLRDSIYRKIDREIELAKKGKKALIMLKLNSLSDQDMVAKLYEASNYGVEINILCRGICSMKPINDKITIKSTIGRFLEHSRIYYFHNDNKQDIFISSADLLTRNLDRRIEILVPVTELNTKSKLLRILLSQMKDKFNTFVMKPKGAYKNPSDKGDNVHESFINLVIKETKVKKKEIK